MTTASAQNYNWHSFDGDPTAPVQPQREADGFFALALDYSGTDTFEPMSLLFTPPPLPLNILGPEDLAAEYEKGKKAATDEALRLQTALHNTISTLEQKNAALEAKLTQMHRQAHALSSDILNQLLTAAKTGSLRLAPDAWRDALSTLMASARLEKNAQLQVHPAQLLEVKAALEHHPQFEGITIISDDQASLGDMHFGDGTQNWMITMQDLFDELNTLLVSPNDTHKHSDASNPSAT